MKGNYNSLILSGVLIGTSMLIIAFITACESSAPEIFQGLCSLIGGAIGAGGAAFAVYLTLNWQKEDQRILTLKALYLELSNYLNHCLSYHGLFKSALEDDIRAKKYMSENAIHFAFNLPSPIFFQSVISNVTRLKEPSLVTLFYSSVESLRADVGADFYKTAETNFLSEPQIRFAIISIVSTLLSGLRLLKSSDFNEIETENRQTLIKTVENEVANSPAAFMNNLGNLSQ